MDSKDIKRICVFCGSSSQVDSRLFVEVKRLGGWLAEHGIELVYGAGNVGLMGALADSVLACGGKVTGVIPRFMVDAGWHHERLQQLLITNTMHERKQLMCEMSDAVISFPGGIGTAEELLETLTWKQLGLITKPIVIMNGAHSPLGCCQFAECQGSSQSNTFCALPVCAAVDALRKSVANLATGFADCLPF